MFLLRQQIHQCTIKKYQKSTCPAQPQPITSPWSAQIRGFWIGIIHLRKLVWQKPPSVDQQSREEHKSLEKLSRSADVSI